jgi:integrase
VQVDRLDDL